MVGSLLVSGQCERRKSLLDKRLIESMVEQQTQQQIQRETLWFYLRMKSSKLCVTMENVLGRWRQNMTIYTVKLRVTRNLPTKNRTQQKVSGWCLICLNIHYALSIVSDRCARAWAFHFRNDLEDVIKWACSGVPGKRMLDEFLTFWACSLSHNNVEWRRCVYKTSSCYSYVNRLEACKNSK